MLEKGLDSGIIGNYGVRATELSVWGSRRVRVPLIFHSGILMEVRKSCANR